MQRYCEKLLQMNRLKYCPLMATTFAHLSGWARIKLFESCFMNLMNGYDFIIQAGLWINKLSN